MIDHPKVSNGYSKSSKQFIEDESKQERMMQFQQKTLEYFTNNQHTFDLYNFMTVIGMSFYCIYVKFSLYG